MSLCVHKSQCMPIFTDAMQVQLINVYKLLFVLPIGFISHPAFFELINLNFQIDQDEKIHH